MQERSTQAQESRQRISERWHRVAIQQAAGIAQSWRTNREQQAEGTLNAQTQEPVWTEWDVPTLRQTCIQANANVVVLEPSHDSTFDYWLKISTLKLRKLLLVPVKLADYHRKALEGDDQRQCDAQQVR